MKNSILLERASKLVKGCAKLCKENKGVYGIDEKTIFVSSNLFHELEKEENLLKHVEKELKEEDRTWYYSAMTQDGAKIIANEWMGAK